MKLVFEYGNGMMSAELPDSTEVFIPGQTVKDPPCLPQDWEPVCSNTGIYSQPDRDAAAAGTGRAGEDGRIRHS